MDLLVDRKILENRNIDVADARPAQIWHERRRVAELEGLRQPECRRADVGSRTGDAAQPVDDGAGSRRGLARHAARARSGVRRGAGKAEVERKAGLQRENSVYLPSADQLIGPPRSSAAESMAAPKRQLPNRVR